MSQQSRNLLVWAGALAFVVGLLATGFLWGEDESREAQRQSSSGVERNAPALEPSDGVTATAREAQIPSMLSDDHGLAIRGRVITLAGDPVEGAIVQSSAGATARAGADGRFACKGLEPGVHWLRVDAADMVGHPAAPVRLLENDVDGIVLRVERARSLRGVVRDRSGDALEGVRVTGRMDRRDALPGWRFTGSSPIDRVLEIESDAQGRFELGPLSAGTVEVTASRLGFVGFGRAYPTDAGELELTLTSLPCVFGCVVDHASGQAVVFERVYALVSRRDMDGPWVRMDDASGLAQPGAEKGSFRLWPRTNRPIRVVADVAGYAPVTSEPIWLRRTDEGPMLLRAKPGASIRGLISGADGEGVAAQVSVLPASSEHGARSSATSTPTGEFELRTPALGAAELIVRAEGFLEHRERIEVTVEAEVQRVELVPAAVLEVVLDASHRATLPELWLRLRESEEATGRVPDQRLVEARSRLDGLRAGTYELELYDVEPRRAGARPPLVATSVDLLAGVAQSVIVAPSDTGGVEGTLTLDGAAAPFRQITLFGPSREAIATCITDRDGRYAFQWLAVGSYALGVGLDPRVPSSHRHGFDLGQGEQRSLDLAVESAGLRGTVLRDPGGSPLRGAQILLEGREPGTGRPFEVARLRSDGAGEFSLDGLVGGSLLLSVQAVFSTQVDRKEVWLLPGRMNDLGTQLLGPAGRIDVMVRRSAGVRDGVGELTVELVHPLVDHPRTVRCTGPGTARFDGVPPGEVELTIRAEGEVLATRSAFVIVERAETVFVDID